MHESAASGKEPTTFQALANRRGFFISPFQPAHSTHPDKPEVRDMRMEKFTNGAALGTGSTTVLFGALSLNEWAIVIGIICTLGTFGVNWYYRWREYQLKRGVE